MTQNEQYDIFINNQSHVFEINDMGDDMYIKITNTVNLLSYDGRFNVEQIEKMTYEKNMKLSMKTFIAVLKSGILKKDKNITLDINIIENVKLNLMLSIENVIADCLNKIDYELELLYIERTVKDHVIDLANNLYEKYPPTKIITKNDIKKIKIELKQYVDVLEQNIHEVKCHVKHDIKTLELNNDEILENVKILGNKIVNLETAFVELEIQTNASIKNMDELMQKIIAKYPI
jgi:hypothetical protein